MSRIRLLNVVKSFDDLPVLRGVNLRIDDGDCIGLIGKNGSGKTTILRLLLGRDSPTAGSVQFEGKVNIGYFSQFSELDGSRSIFEVLDDLFSPVHQIQDRLKAIDGEMTLPEADLGRLIEEQAKLLEEMELVDGWNYGQRIETVLSRLRFDQDRQLMPVDSLSGGWRNRAALAKILLESPDILLLDEPTNYLDVTGVEWLETWISRFRGIVIVVSHDRNFLDRVVTRMIEIENYHLHEYPGNFTQYVREKTLRFKKLQKQFVHEEELLAYEAESIRERSEAQKNTNHSLKRRLANVKKTVAPKPLDLIVTGLYEGIHQGRKKCTVERVTKKYDDDELFGDLSFELLRGDRLAVLGPNGCGKSSLLRILVQKESPDSGQVRWERGDDYASFDFLLNALDQNDTVTHAINVHGLGFNAPRKTVHRFLEALQFSEADLRKRIGTLSAGQKARVALAQCLISGASTIVLDEPTNHLDLTTTQVMERALISFPGAVVVVSHDRFFVDKVATRLLVCRSGESGGTKKRWMEFNGNWSMWQAETQGQSI